MTRHADEVKLRTTENRLQYAMTHPKEIACDELRDMVRDIRDLLAANAELQAQYDAAGKASAETLTQLIECEKAHAALAAKCERMEGALRRIDEAIAAGEANQAHFGERNTWNPDAHLELTITVSDAWAIRDALKEPV